MSLEYKNEEVPPDKLPEVTENIQPVEPITPYYTYILLGCLVAVTMSQFATDLESSVLMAGFVKSEFWEKQQYWRILTGGALHGNIFHIFFNGFALLSFGKLVELLSNKAHLATVFLLSVIGGGWLSFVFQPHGSSVGASGGIVGLIGYLAVYGFLRRKLLSSAFLKSILINIAIIAFIGVFVLPNIDNFGHLGGFLVGVIYGFLQIPRDLHQDPREVGAVTEGVGMVALGIFVFTSIFAILLILQYIRF